MEEIRHTLGNGDEGAADTREHTPVKLPRDRVLYRDLQTSFTRFDRLLEDLELRETDGYLELTAPAGNGTIYLAGGAVVAADVHPVESGDEPGEALTAIMQVAGDPGGVINVYEAPAALVRLASSRDEQRPLYENLSTEFVDVNRLMITLERQSITGFVRFALRNGKSTGYLFLREGAVVDAVLADDGHAGSGLSLVPTMMQAIDAAGARIDVYSVPPPDDAGEPHEAAEETRPVGVAALAPAWSAILAAVEEVVDDSSEPGRFISALNEALEERAREYPYLDPAAAMFDYREGRVRFHAPPPDEFSTVLGECLSDAVSRISFRLRKVDLESSIQARLEDVMEEHGDTIGRYGIPRTASSFLAA